MMSTVRDLFKGCSWRVCECQSESKSDFSGMSGESKNEKPSERFMAWPLRQLKSLYMPYTVSLALLTFWADSRDGSTWSTCAVAR